MPTFLREELLAEGLVEARHLGLEGGGVEGFADDGVEYTFDGSNHYQMHVYDAICPSSPARFPPATGGRFSNRQHLAEEFQVADLGVVGRGD